MIYDDLTSRLRWESSRPGPGFRDRSRKNRSPPIPARTPRRRRPGSLRGHRRHLRGRPHARTIGAGGSHGASALPCACSTRRRRCAKPRSPPARTRGEPGPRPWPRVGQAPGSGPSQTGSTSRPVEDPVGAGDTFERGETALVESDGRGGSVTEGFALRRKDSTRRRSGLRRGDRAVFWRGGSEPPHLGWLRALFGPQAVTFYNSRAMLIDGAARAKAPGGRHGRSPGALVFPCAGFFKRSWPCGG